LVRDWLEIVNQLYPTNQVLHAKWDAGDLTSLMMDKGLVADGSKIFTQIIGGAPLAKVLSVTVITVNKVTGHWKKAFQETKEVGLELAITLEENKMLHGSILMGHSLGVRVIRHTLADLEKPVVDTAYLLAGAVSSEQSQWSDIFENHSETKFINCMSQNDSVLKTPINWAVYLIINPLA
jgi:hypothetical protein